MQEPDDLLIVDDHPGEIRLIEEVVESADIETTLYTASEKALSGLLCPHALCSPGYQ